MGTLGVLNSYPCCFEIQKKKVGIEEKKVSELVLSVWAFIGIE